MEKSIETEQVTERWETTLTFSTLEEVTPRIFGLKVALACARQGALRPGEMIDTGVHVYRYNGDKQTTMKELGFRGNDPITIPDIEQVYPKDDTR